MVMKFIAAGVAFSAAMIRSPSFSRSASSVTITILPAAISPHDVVNRVELKGFWRFDDHPIPLPSGLCSAIRNHFRLAATIASGSKGHGCRLGIRLSGRTWKLGEIDELAEGELALSSFRGSCSKPATRWTASSSTLPRFVASAPKQVKPDAFPGIVSFDQIAVSSTIGMIAHGGTRELGGEASHRPAR